MAAVRDLASVDLTFTALDADNVHVALNTFKLGIVPDVAPARVVAVIDVSGSMEEVCMGVFSIYY
jgi:hypothetical protein